MGTSDNGQEVLRQNLEEKGTFQALYQMHLLFREKGKRPEGKKILGRLQKEFGQVDLVADVDHSLATFAIADFPVEYKKDKKVIPAQVLMADFTHFDQFVAQSHEGGNLSVGIPDNKKFNSG